MSDKLVDPFPPDDGLDATQLMHARINVGLDFPLAAAKLRETPWPKRIREHYALWMAEALILYAIAIEKNEGGVSLVEHQLTRFIGHLLIQANAVTGRKITWGVRYETPDLGEKGPPDGEESQG